MIVVVEPDLAVAVRRALERRGSKYSEDQPRVPAGQSGGGQWTSGGAGGGSGGGDAADDAAGAAEREAAELEAFIREAKNDPRTRAAEEAIASGTPSTEGKLVDGKWTPEAEADHRRIVDKMLNPKAAVPEGETPTAVFFMGSPGSGKTTALGDTVKGEYTTLNPDIAKAELAGYDGSNASLYHEESSHISDILVARAAIEGRHNIIYDGTGKTGSKYVAMAKELVDRGYRVEIRFADVTPLTAVKRVHERFLKANRYVPLDYVAKDIDGKPAKTYEAMKASGYVSRAVRVDNNGKAARVVEDVALKAAVT